MEVDWQEMSLHRKKSNIPYTDKCLPNYSYFLGIEIPYERDSPYYSS